MIPQPRWTSPLTALSVLVALPVVAQRPAAHRDSVQTATVRRLLELTNTSENLAKMVDAMLPAQRRAYPDLPDAYWEAFAARARQILPRLVDSLIPVYTARFSQAELEQLVQFYASPVGRHLIEAQPEVFQESFEIGRRWGERVGREVRDSLGQAGGAWAELAVQAAMKSDLRNLIVAEEAFFADSVKYTAHIGAGGLDYRPSPGDTILTLRLTEDGWVAAMGSAKTNAMCAIFVGSTPIAPAVVEGEPRCADH